MSTNKNTAATLLNDLSRTLTSEELAQLTTLLNLGAERALAKRDAANNRFDQRANDERNLRLLNAADALNKA